MGINFNIKDSEKLIAKIPFKSILAIISLLCAFLIFCPDKVLNKLFLLELRNKVDTYIGLIFVVSLAIWAVIIISILSKRIDKKTAFNNRNSKKRFAQLSRQSLKIVLEMYESPSHSMLLDLSDATTNMLESAHFITRGAVSSLGLYFDYFLHPWVVKHLDKNFSYYKKQLDNMR